MKTQVLKIQPISENDNLEIWIAIGNQQQKFTFSRNFEQIGDNKIAIITYNHEFGEIFKFNQHLMTEVINLIKQYYQGETINLPQEIGDFGDAEIALALQKPFHKDSQLQEVT